MTKEHLFKTKIVWTGNTGEGTSSYQAYKRDHTISIEHKVDVLGSSDPAFLGDGSKHNPEDLLISALSACHMMWYLHMCASNGIQVVAYEDNATGILLENPGQGGHFKEVVLYPNVTISNSDQMDLANKLHAEANQKCFIANSCNFPVKHVVTCLMSTEN